MTELRSSIADRDARIGVVGLGYVGLPLAVAFAGAGFPVRGVDVDRATVDSLERGISPVDDVDDATVRRALDRGFEPSASNGVLAGCEVVVFAVPTGVENGRPDMTPLSTAVEAAAHQRAGERTLYVVSSTVYPGAVEDVVRPALDRAGAAPDRSPVAAVPERIDPGSDVGVGGIPVVVGADDPGPRRRAGELFSTVAPSVHPVGSTAVAAASKMLENTYRLVNISLVNEFAMFAEGEGIDVWETVEAAATKPFGFEAFYPGAGAGGHCIPLDPRFVTWRARQHGVRLDTITTATEINRTMPGVVVNTLDGWLTDHGRDLADVSVSVVGLTYKPDVADTRNSPALAVCERLATRAGSVTAYDPLVGPGDVDLPADVDCQDRPTVEDVGPDEVLVYLVDHSCLDVNDVVDRAGFAFDVTNSLDGTEPGVRVFGGPQDCAGDPGERLQESTPAGPGHSGDSS